MRLLLIEDDEAFGQALNDALELAGHQVDWLRDGRLVEGRLKAYRFDAVLLDLGLPDIDGHELLLRLRAQRDSTPVLVLSARSQRADRIQLLDAGADDYIVKPVDLGELEARLRAVLRRGSPQGSDGEWLRHGALQLAPRLGTVVWQGRRLSLRERERWLLELLMRHPDRTFTRAQIESDLYGRQSPADSNMVEVYVHHLRRQIVADIVVTVRGLGYRLGPPPAES
jgi:DNA-binding response OmpR family regulator